MAYNDLLAARVQRALGDRTDVTEKRMFAGLTFMLAGNMCCGVNHDDLILRLNGKTGAAELDSPHVLAWDFMKRPMKGMFAVGLQGCTSQQAVDDWVGMAVRHALTLPRK
jgi:TfoX-like protein